MSAVSQLLEQQRNSNGRHSPPSCGGQETACVLGGCACATPAKRLDAQPVRLNLGSGERTLAGYDNVDRKQGREVYPLDFPDGFASEIRASHVLEHFSHREVGAVLHEWVRVLKPGGILKVAVPDFEWIARAYLSGEPANVQGYVMGGHVDANDRHGCIFDRDELARDLRAVGLYDVRPWKSEIDDCAALPVSLNLQGRKKKPLPKLRIECAMSVPRLGFQDNFFCWAQALLPLGITPMRYDGAFWGQCLERVMAEQAASGTDYILTLDYDSVFTRDHVEHLIRLAAEHPEADAIAAVQLRRAGDTLLTTIPGPDGKATGAIPFDTLIDHEITPAHTAHFGLTLLRVEALKRMPHPWFLGVPAPDGGWGEGRTDDDTHFWRKWKATGNTLFLASHVVVAHGQFMLTWPDREMKPLHQHPSDFWKDGPPREVWK